MELLAFFPPQLCFFFFPPLNLMFFHFEVFDFPYLSFISPFPISNFTKYLYPELIHSNVVSEFPAHHLFDKMAVCWSSLATTTISLLHVTVRHLRYPMTEDVLRQIFNVYGIKEKVYVLQKIAHVNSRPSSNFHHVLTSMRSVYLHQHHTILMRGQLHGWRTMPWVLLLLSTKAPSSPPIHPPCV